MKTNSKIKTSIFALFTSFALVFALIPEYAIADIRDTDIIADRTVAQYGASPSNLPSISAEYAYVIDADGNIYFERNPDAQTNIASLTKIMTAAIALESSDLSREISVSANAASIGESTAQLLAGDTLTLEDAIYGLMIPSGNDAACAIAENVGNDILDIEKSEGVELVREDGSTINSSDENAAYDAFVAKMNSKAAELGCNNTKFTNPHGLDIGRYAQDMHSSAKDMALICSYAMQNETFRNIVSAGDTSITVQRAGVAVDILLESTDILLDSYEGACGIKTGHTNTAGSCFAGACQRNGKMIYTVVLNSPTNNQRFTDTKTLLDWVYSSETDVAISNSSEICMLRIDDGDREVPLIAEVANTDWIDKTFPVTFADPDAKVHVSSIFGNLSEDIIIEKSSGNISSGEVVGHVDFYQNNKLISSEDLIACGDVNAPNLFESISIGWQNLTGKISDDDRAHTVIYNEIPVLIKKV